MSSIAKLYMKVFKGTPSKPRDEKVPPDIAGESIAQGFEGQIEIDDWSWALKRNSSDATPKIQVGAAALYNPNDAVPSVFSFSKNLDRSTTALLAAAKSGEKLYALITLEESSELDFEMEIALENVRVIDYQLNVQNEDKSGKGEENWKFNYESIYFDYKQNAKSGVARLKLDRKPGASTAAAPGNDSKLMEAAEQFSHKDLKDIYVPKLLAAAEKRGQTPPPQQQQQQQPTGRG